ncbi:MAG: GGDEF domain-containing protein [Deltaproteobacteria bacterium]|nr:GGDEF domain-containing protein [Deltaproteobacteria bacterium]
MKALAESTIEIPTISETAFERGALPRADLQLTLESLLSENKLLRQELAELQSFRALAYRDPLTGLWNRRYFDERLSEEISRARRKLDYTFSLILVDVNDLKLVNDGEGHAAGDTLLRWVARFLQSTTRAHDLVCRLGGDEFGLILPDCGSAQAHIVETRLRDGLAEANKHRKESVGMSLGTACCPEAGLLAEALVRTADVAMYADKRRQKAGRTLKAIAYADDVCSDDRRR